MKVTLQHGERNTTDVIEVAKVNSDGVEHIGFISAAELLEIDVTSGEEIVFRINPTITVIDSAPVDNGAPVDNAVPVDNAAPVDNANAVPINVEKLKNEIENIEKDMIDDFKKVLENM